MQKMDQPIPHDTSPKNNLSTSASTDRSLSKSLGKNPAISASNPVDFVSFPTLPDPEDDKNQTLTKLFTKTLRRVTNNASHIVMSYSSPKSVHSNENDGIDGIESSTPLRLHTSNSSVNEIQDRSRKLQDAIDNPELDHQDLGEERPLTPVNPIITLEGTNEGTDKHPESGPNGYYKETSDIQESLHPPASLNEEPKVLADSKSLRFASASVMEPESTTNSVVAVNAMANNDPPPAEPIIPSKPVSKRSSKKSLLNRISSIFTNLPNDIELSDDSASDTETVRNGDSPITEAPPTPYQLHPDFNMYSGSIVKSSPTKAHQTRNSDSSPGYNSFDTLRQYDVKKKPSNLSTSLIGNARSIINQNFNGSMSSASSVKQSRKKKKTKRPSGNPLKSGGIPKKYWMNDAFVSECLNCFRPFSAFRRKHHCRFCGQIFCSKCTLFISYEEHKEQRKTGVINPDKKHYDDKLRVCKPCYSDVIVYLSDTDSSSSDNSDGEDAVSFETLDKFKDDLPQHPFASRDRSRSLSMSRKDGPLEANKSFLKPPDDKLKSPLSLSIPTTRQGESVQIPLKILYSGSYNRSSSQDPSWVKNFPHLMRTNSQLGSSVPRSGSQDNLNLLMGNGKLSRIRSNADVDGVRRSRSGKFEDTSDARKRYTEQAVDDEDDDEDELESENEDEKAMSLYTSLNYGGFNNNVNTSTISPRAPLAMPLATVSANAVPTLGEFPTMQVNERLYPKNMSSSFRSTPGGSIFPRIAATTGFNENGQFPEVNLFQKNILQDSPKSNLRSHERAHASLLRIRSRRRAKTARNLQVLTNNKLPSMDYSELQDTDSPVSVPTSPTPEGAGLSTGYFRDFNGNDTFSPLEDSMTDSTLQAKHQISFGSLSNIDSNNRLPTKVPTDQLTTGLFDEVVRRLDTVYLDQFNKILAQCLEDCDIKDHDGRWSAVLKSCVNAVNGLQLTDTLDIKQYVKVKRICGGRIEDTHRVDGLLMTKNIDSKRMSSSIENPKIALLMFPIEYLKQKEQFISLRIVQSQQDVYISNLVSRLISLEPDIIVVGDTVCQLAKEFLEEANITVISNTKPQVIERISRYTKTDIFQSVNDLFFKKGSLGTCSKFEVKKYAYKDTVKTFACFLGTDPEQGFTITLRGGDEETLNSIKYTTENLLSLQVNAKFEKGYFEDSKLVYSEDLPNDSASYLANRLNLIKNEAVNGEDENSTMPDEKEVFEYIDLFLQRLISTSPSSKFSLPTPLINLVESFITLYNFNERNNYLKNCESLDEVETNLIEDLRLNIDLDKMPNKGMDLLKFLKHSSEIRTRSLLNQFQSRSKTWSNYSKLPSYQLYPIFHKSIHLLYSNVSMKFNTPCLGPNIIMVEYYTDNDKFLGLQLDQMLTESINDCEECGEPMIDHYRNYVHGDGKLDMVVEKHDQIPPENSRFVNQRTMWSVCKKCNQKTPVTTMSDDTYYFSIGKYFETAFWGKNVRLDGRCECQHDFFKDHIRYFGFNDMFIRIEYSSIDSYEVVVPKKQIEFDTSIEINLKVEALETIREKSNKFFNSVSKRLNRVKVDTFDKAEDGAKRIGELKIKLETQERETNENLLELYNLTPPTSYLPMNSILRELQELAVLWDADFNDFENQYLPSENEITRITQFHLRNFLIDKYNDDNVKEVEMNEIPKNQDGSEEKDSQTESSELSEKKPTEEDTKLVDHLNESPRKEIKKLIPKALEQPNSNVGEMVNRIEKTMEDDRPKRTTSRVNSGSGTFTDDRAIVGSPTKRSVSLDNKATELALPSIQNLGNPDGSSNKPNKVSQLTHFYDQMSFDQISLEFKKQREQELRKNLNRFRALPIVASKPIVEIYNKIEDMVNADEEGDKNIKKLTKRPTSDSAMTKRTEDIVRTDDESRLGKSPEDIDNDKRDKDRREDKSKDKDKLMDIPQPERVSLLKSLTNFWADRSASLWDPLEYPLDSTEHTFADSDIIVREDEPSSLVAFCLSTNDYKQKIKSLGQAPDDDTKIEPNEVNNKKINNFAKVERKFKSKFEDSKKPNDIEKIMTKNKSTHLKYQFTDGTTSLSCKIFYSEQFEALRKSCGKDDRFIQSISRCIKWNSSGGKSKSSFLKTLDNRFIVKELSKSELESFVSLAPFYFKYISQSMFNTLTTALAKIFGIFQIQIKNVVTGKTFRMDFLIMENLFYNNKTTRIFDLKGSMRNRHVTQTGKEDEVLLDENMIEYIYESPLFVREHLKKLLRGSLFNDSSFLSAMDVMDYSLIIGINDQTKKLYIGIIDWLRTFTWDKKVENWVKGNNLIGGNKGKDPTIITPKQYRIRFREAMERYILEVPDIWYEGKN